MDEKISLLEAFFERELQIDKVKRSGKYILLPQIEESNGKFSECNKFYNHPFSLRNCCYSKPYSDITREDFLSIISTTSNSPDEERVKELVDLALQNRRFISYYQPQVLIDESGDVIGLYGLEALARLEGCDGNILSPGFFLPYIEESRTRQNILTEVMLDAVIHDFGDMLPELKVSVNIACPQLEDFHMLNKLREVSDLLTIEITESSEILSSTGSFPIVDNLRLSMDDFGKGFAAVQPLLQIPFKELKIDKLFSDNIFDSKYRTMLISLVTFAREQDIHLIVEGVETEEQVKLLASLGVKIIQGFYFSKPLPPKEVVKWIDGL